jgi:hypothetical protein
VLDRVWAVARFGNAPRGSMSCCKSLFASSWAGLWKRWKAEGRFPLSHHPDCGEIEICGIPPIEQKTLDGWGTQFRTSRVGDASGGLIQNSVAQDLFTEL